MLVLDTSALIASLVGSLKNGALHERLADEELHAPHLVDVEVLHALRRLVRLHHLSADRASDARADFADLTIVRYPHEPLADRIWELRNNLSAYDAAFVALSEALDVPLVTSDGRLARTNGHDAKIELFA